MTKKLMISLVVLAAMTLTQGCAVLYATNHKDTEGNTEREFGLLGGCLPLWHYSSTQGDPEDNEEPDKTP